MIMVVKGVDGCKHAIVVITPENATTVGARGNVAVAEDMVVTFAGEPAAVPFAIAPEDALVVGERVINNMHLHTGFRKK